ncbi:hypothetical protein OPAG_08250 [Rhodococcus opacus PD630]|uniref:DUF2510 domain-containing protein n=1 Tax=Rhodococcus opacus TaxID=37919 RepID=UPI00029CD4C6|nr:DUF2510 domain-containing protein [Rhodococcus opacus]EHI43710.1 hypothetical protein OPAG_08250 [Rhodococcus opacus PD630]UDH01528.1 DUF2510 domain-containing protein [Rhodococcus opacus PD630]
MTTPTPAGWYPDPGNSGLVRWHDGIQWTHQTRQNSTAAQPDTARSAQVWIILPTLGAIALTLFFVSGVAVDPEFNLVFYAFVIAIGVLFGFVVRAMIRTEKTSATFGRTPPADLTPGWHTDPQDPQTLRWYDGAQWTAQTLPANTSPAELLTDRPKASPAAVGPSL